MNKKGWKLLMRNFMPLQLTSLTEEIASDIAAVNTSVNEVSQASSPQVKKSAEELSGVAETLKNMISKFNV